MRNRSITALAALAVFAGASLAEEFKASVKKVDAETNSIVLIVNGERKSYSVAADVEVYTQQPGKNNKPGKKEPVPDGIAGLQPNNEVTVRTVRSGGADIVSAIRLEAPVKKKKDK